MTNDNTLALINRYRSPIMGFAALWIVFFHFWQPLFAEGAPAALFYAENVIKRLGFEGVDTFFLLSGMGLTYSIGKHSLGGFYLRRFKRLAIPFVAVAALRAVCERWGWRAFLFVVSGANFFVGNMYFFLWFVTAIAVLYLVFPLYWRFFSRARSKLAFTLAVIAVWYVLSLALVGVLPENKYGFTNRIPVFVTGVLLGWCTQKGVTLLSRRAVAVVPVKDADKVDVLREPAVHADAVLHVWPSPDALGAANVEVLRRLVAREGRLPRHLAEPNAPLQQKNRTRLRKHAIIQIDPLVV